MSEVLYCYRKNRAGITHQGKDDYSYVSFAIRNCLRRIPLDEIFPEFNWEDCGAAQSRAVFHIATGLMNVGDVFNGTRFLECIPIEYLTPHALSLSIRAALILGRSTHAQGILSSSRLVHANSRVDLHRSLRTLIEDAKNAEILIMESQQAKKHKELIQGLKRHHQLLGPSFFTSCVYSDRFQSIGDYSRSRKFLEAAYRYNPLNEELFLSMRESSRNAEEKEEVFKLQQRMLGEEPDAPLFFLSWESRQMRQIFNFSYRPCLDRLPLAE